jgi:dienelactone hydrolase
MMTFLSDAPLAQLDRQMKERQMKTILRLVSIALTFACSADAPMAFAQHAADGNPALHRRRRARDAVAVLTAENQGASVAMSWEKAEVFVPGSFFTTTPNNVKVNKPLPVVIYLHGCTGINPDHDTLWGDFIKGLGYIAVLPDSMARPGRIPNCDPKKMRGGAFPQAHAMRMEEIRYALEQVQKSDWADTNNVFLMGDSEGGQAAARDTLGDFRGIIISGWTCTNSARPDFDGIFAPLETPILTLEWDHDAWREGTPQQGSCANKFGERKKARQVLFSGTQHFTYDQWEARDADAQFLKENLVTKSP